MLKRLKDMSLEYGTRFKTHLNETKL